jgi:DNA-binding NarL/FixJ family response regulator
VTVIRALLVDDDAMVRTGLNLMLTASRQIEVVAEVSDGDEVVSAVLAHRPDVVLMDLRMTRMNGIDATAAVCALQPAPAVLVLTSFESGPDVLRALEAGAQGFLLKDASPTEMIAGVLSVAQGDSVLAPRAARHVVSHVAAGAVSSEQHLARQQLALLTDREREIALTLPEGLGNAEIAARLYCSEATVKTHLGRAMTKLGLDNRVQLAIIAERARPLRPV